MIAVASTQDGATPKRRDFGARACKIAARHRILPLKVALLCLAINAVPVEAADRATGAIGQIVPGSGVVDILGTPGSRVVAIYVRQDQAVSHGTLLMLTQSTSPNSDPALAKLQLNAARDLADQQVAAQSLAVHLAEAHRIQAKNTLQVYRMLGTTIVSKKELNSLRDAAEDARLALELERAKLRIAATQAQSALRSAQRQYDLATQGAELRAPIDGTVLRINRRVGEQLGNDAAVQIADLRSMYVICQVYEGDLLGLAPGMGVTIKAQPLAKSLHGRIEEVGRVIDTRARLGEVRIRLDSAEPANRLVGMEVEVNIDR